MNDPTDFSRAVADADEGEAKSIARLEKNITELEDKRKEERFLWIIVILIVMDVSVFPHMESWGGPVSILTLEIIALLIIARHCGIEEVHQLIDKIINAKSG